MDTAGQPTDKLFWDVKLLTRQREHVALIKVPKFTPMPDALMWGERLFIRQVDGSYTEGFCYAVVDETNIMPGGAHVPSEPLPE